MKTVKAWEALKIFQENGTECIPVDWVVSKGYKPPNEWPHWENRLFYLEPRPKVVEIILDYTREKWFIDAELCDDRKLQGKRWRCVCTEIVEGEE